MDAREQEAGGSFAVFAPLSILAFLVSKDGSHPGLKPAMILSLRHSLV